MKASKWSKHKNRNENNLNLRIMKKFKVLENSRFQNSKALDSIKGGESCTGGEGLMQCNKIAYMTCAPSSAVGFHQTEMCATMHGSCGGGDYSFSFCMGQVHGTLCSGSKIFTF